MTSEMKDLRYVREGEADRLYEAIVHGDAEHRRWLREACTNFFANEPVPPPRGMGRAEAAEAEVTRLREALEFYADEANWKVPKIGWSEIGIDRGRKARAALPDTELETGERGYCCPRCKEWIEGGMEPDGCRDPDCPALPIEEGGEHG